MSRRNESRSRHRHDSDSDSEPATKHHKSEKKKHKSSSSSKDYKTQYEDAKHDLDKKRRKVHDLEDEIDKLHRDAKKAKEDTADLWKIYYQLQTELQQSYERNAKLSAEKSKIQHDHDEISEELTKIRGSASDPTKLREALITMQKEKIGMQRSYNELVLENQRLREIESKYAPRLTEVGQLKQEVISTREQVLKMKDIVAKAQEAMTLVQFNREVVERYQKWNSALSMSCDESAYRVRELEAQTTVTPIDERVNLLHRHRQKVWSALEQLSADVRLARADWAWTGDALKETVLNTNEALSKSLEQFRQQLKTHTKHANANSNGEGADKKTDCLACQMHKAANAMLLNSSKQSQDRQRQDICLRLNELVAMVDRECHRLPIDFAAQIIDRLHSGLTTLEKDTDDGAQSTTATATSATATATSTATSRAPPSLLARAPPVDAHRTDTMAILMQANNSVRTRARAPAPQQQRFGAPMSMSSPMPAPPQPLMGARRDFFGVVAPGTPVAAEGGAGQDGDDGQEPFVRMRPPTYAGDEGGQPMG